MTDAEKDSLSHRGKAYRMLAEHLRAEKAAHAAGQR
jgi:inosine/xanthosine triphosphate pyrophosphatase family protein